MNLTPILAAVAPAPAAPGDARPNAATGTTDAAAEPGNFARALSEAGAPGRSPNDAADNTAHAAAGPQASAGQSARPAARQETQAAPAEPDGPDTLPPATSTRSAAATPRLAATTVPPLQKARAALGSVDAAAAKPSVAPDADGSTLTETPKAALPDAAVPGSAADTATTLLAELQALHPAPTAAPIQADPALRRDDDSAAVLRLLQRPLAAAAKPADEPVVAEPVIATPIAALRTVPGAGTAPPPLVEARAADAMAAALPVAPMSPATAPVTALPTGLAAAPVAEARLTASPGSAEFSTQLGSQLTTFVRDGIQHARLHLNPAEMGPVTVQIRIDGQAAQVHMASENGLTRQALEQSMPLLAGSLREAGLTLSGGGVFEQPRQARDGAPPGAATSSRPGPEAADDGALHQTLTPARSRGVVDLVA